MEFTWVVTLSILNRQRISSNETKTKMKLHVFNKSSITYSVTPIIEARTRFVEVFPVLSKIALQFTHVITE